MKRFVSVFFSILAMLVLFSCERISPVADEDTIEVKLSLGGDVEFIDEPMTKAWGESNSVYGIKVYVFNENVSTYEPYAYGIFASASNLSITLTTTKKYQFEVAYLKDFTDKYSFIDSYQYHPYTEPTNGFVYGTNYFFPYLWGITTSSITNKTEMIESDFYYGSITDYIPSNTCSIALYRKTFGIDITVEGMKEGTLECRLSSMQGANYLATMSFSYPQTSISKLFSYKDLAFNGSKQWFIEINYLDSSSNKTCIANEKLTFSVCTRKKIVVKLKSNTPTSQQISVSFSLSDNALSEESIEYQGTI